MMHTRLRAREGDFIETKAGLIFDVKGLTHPIDRIVAFIRYFPDEKGKRIRDGTRFGKVYSLSTRYDLLRARFPEYLVYDPVFDETLCEVPANQVEKHYKPVEKLHGMRNCEVLDRLEAKAVRFMDLLKENSSVRWDDLGVSGSILLGLHSSKSDIDPVVYGSKNCQRVRSCLSSMLKNGHESVKPYTKKDLRKLFDFRSKDTSVSFEDFVQTEKRKVMQGKFERTDYFIRFVKDWKEIDEKYGDVRYENLGYARIEATVVDDSQSIFTPCTYEVENVKPIEGLDLDIAEITSFRGRFCEQAKKGELIVANGKVERVTDRRSMKEHFRLIIGGKPSDYLVLKG
jgi:predicted nucleotidyltransferase